jgi:hypothetical protein
MSEKREFPILNGKLLSDLDLNGHKLLGLTLPEGGGGGSSVEVVPPSADGAGKAADAKAVYEALEGKQDALNDGQMAAVNSGVTKDEWDRVAYLSNRISYKIPIYVDATAILEDGIMRLVPFCRNLAGIDDSNFKIEEVLIYGPNHGVVLDSSMVRDLSLVIDCRGRETAPTITWGACFHPRTDAETDFACVAGMHNVYWISEYAPGEFVVAGWQATEGGKAE